MKESFKQYFTTLKPNSRKELYFVITVELGIFAGLYIRQFY